MSILLAVLGFILAGLLIPVFMILCFIIVCLLCAWTVFLLDTVAKLFK